MGEEAMEAEAEEEEEREERGRVEEPGEEEEGEEDKEEEEEKRGREDGSDVMTAAGISPLPYRSISVNVCCSIADRGGG